MDWFRNPLGATFGLAHLRLSAVAIGAALILTVAGAPPGNAQGDVPAVPAPPPAKPADPSVAPPDPALCRALVSPPHPAEGAGAAYVPGVDVRGRPVASADVGGGVGVLGSLDDIAVPLVVAPNPDHRVGGAGPDAIPLGTLTVRDGRLELDGRPFAHPDPAALWDACRRVLHERGP